MRCKEQGTGTAQGPKKENHTCPATTAEPLRNMLQSSCLSSGGYDAAGRRVLPFSALLHRSSGRRQRFGMTEMGGGGRGSSGQRRRAKCKGGRTWNQKLLGLCGACKSVCSLAAVYLRALRLEAGGRGKSQEHRMCMTLENGSPVSMQGRRQLKAWIGMIPAEV